MKRACEIAMVVVVMVMALLLSVGSFMGFPNDAQLSGIYWLATFGLWAVNVCDWK